MLCQLHAPFAMVPLPGDGAGILVAMPDSFLHSVLSEEQGIQLPAFGELQLLSA